MKKIAMLFFMLLASFQLFAQGRITGVVIDAADNQPLIGASVLVKGTSKGGITDIDGKFSIEVPAGKTQIVISSVGYKSQTINVAGHKTLKVVLHEDSKVMDEVVVIGYGSMKKRDLSGAVGQIKNEDLMKGNALDLGHGLQGKMAGVQINQNDGAPGGGVSITVRGANSFSTSSQPLYIVDGVPFESASTPTSGANDNVNQTMNPLSFINPHDIESIEVLKDASATAIYGSRGANGVVLITTKRGKTGKPKVELSTNYSISAIGKRIKMLDPVTYANYINEETKNSIYYEGSQTNTLPYSGKWTYAALSDGHLDYSTGTYNPSPEDFNSPGYYRDEYGNVTQVGVADWQDEIYQTGFSQEYNLNVSGGDSNGWYSFSGNYAKQNGIIKNSGYERYGIRANIGKKITDWLEIGTNTSFTNSTTDFAKTNAYDYSIIRSALLFPPTYGPNMDTTTSDQLNWLAANPAAYVRSAKDQVKGINWFSSSYLEIKIFPFLKFRQNLGLGYNDNHRGTYYDRHTQEGKSPTNGKAGKSYNIWKSLTAESLLTFDKKFGDHALNAVAGFTIEEGFWDNMSVTVTNFPDDMTQDNDLSRGLTVGTPTSDHGKQQLASFLGRVNYTYKDKYILTASIRTDGSSKFTSKNKWATFPSAAIAWRASEEDFIKNLNIFSNLKIRASYGETGNQGIGSYRTIPMLSTANYPFGGSLSSGSAQVSWRGPVSDNLKWETTAQFDAGIDFGFLDNRLMINVDYYHKKTRDLLQEVKINGSSGFSNYMINSGNVTNEGLEFTLNYNILKDSPVKWDISANLSFNRNRIGGLAADQFANTLWYNSDDVFIQRNGCPIGAIYGYVEDGFYDNEAEVRADPQYTFAKASTVKSMVGEIKYRDLNNDGKITKDDRTIIGNTNPDYVYGITNNLSFKNFTLSFLLQGSHGNDIFNGNLQDVKLGNIGNIPLFAYNSRWTSDNYESALWPKATAGYTRNMLISNRYVEDGSYLKLKNVSIAYDWRNPFKGMESIKFSASASNLFCITNYDWFDPDVNAFGTDASRRGVDIYSYPSARTFSFGVNFTF